MNITKHAIIVTIGLIKNRGAICTPKQAKEYLEAEEGDVANAVLCFLHDQANAPGKG